MVNGDSPDPEAALAVSLPAPAHIDKVENGFIIKVGCKIFVSRSWTEVADALGQYWDNPIAAEWKFCNH